MNDNHDHEDRRPERRRTPAITEAQIALMVEEEVERRLAKFEDKIIAHMDVKFGQMHKMFSDAFPDGDPHGHRMYHERSIKTADQWSKFKMGLVDKLAAGGAWAILGFVALALWDYFKREVQR